MLFFLAFFLLAKMLNFKQFDLALNVNFTWLCMQECYFLHMYTGSLLIIKIIFSFSHVTSHLKFISYIFFQ